MEDFLRKDDINDEAYIKAKALVDKMSVEECMGQLRFDAPSVKRLGIPSYNWWNEGLHGLARSGVATMFPQAIGMAAMFSEEWLEKAGDITSTEARAKYNVYQKKGDHDIYKGLTLWAPNINIDRDPRWGRGQETYGEDPYLTGRLGCAYIKGLQGDKDILKTAACAKHMAVHSGPEVLRHEFDAIAGPKDMEETYLPAFQETITEARVEGVMGAYNRVNGEAACASSFLQGKLKEWDFQGYFTSDCWAIRDFHEYHHVTDNIEESAALALRYGCDVNCGCSYVHLPAAYKKGLVSEEDIRRACIHLFRTRYRLGIMGEGSEYDEIPYSVVSCKEHKEVSYQCALRSMVLLHNDGILPLSEKKIKSIAVIGPNADSRAVLAGNYEGTADHYHTYLEGITGRFDGQVMYAEGCYLTRENKVGMEPKERLAEALSVAELADVTILCVGLDATLEGEEDAATHFTGDKDDLLLPKVQRELVEAVMALNKPVIIVNSSGSSINCEARGNALIQAWYPGSEGGRALAALLFGDVSPSGKLPITFYENTDALPAFTDYSMAGRTYRYTRENVLYPFGYGLTYGDVVVEKVEYSVGEEGAEVLVTACNHSDTDTEDVLQVYVHSKDPDDTKYPHLAAFKRELFKAHQEKTVRLMVGQKALTVVDMDGCRHRAQGDIEITVTNGVK